jgi:hypothetical protein
MPRIPRPIAFRIVASLDLYVLEEPHGVNRADVSIDALPVEIRACLALDVNADCFLVDPAVALDDHLHDVPDWWTCGVLRLFPSLRSAVPRPLRRRSRRDAPGALTNNPG